MRNPGPGGRLRALASAAILTALFAGAGAFAAADGVPPPCVLLEGGVLRTWDGASTDLAPLPKWVTIRLGDPLATLTLRDGRLLLVLGKSEEESDKHHHRHEGAALLLGWPGGGPADLGFKSQFTVDFDGTPLLAAGTGEHAWVYARDLGAAPGTMARAWVHDIDFQTGRVADSTILPGNVRGLAVEPDGRRLYVGLDDKVLSLTTRPLVTSWQWRSPGANGPLAISPNGGLLAVVRGSALALFDADEIGARPASERRAREDDATQVIPLDHPAHGIAFSDDGRLVAIFGADRVQYVDAAGGARLGEERLAGLTEGGELRPLRFPGGGSDLVVAALPSGAVAAVPSPEPPSRRAGSPVAAGSTAAVVAPPTPVPAAPILPETSAPTASPAAVPTTEEPAPPLAPPPAPVAIGTTAAAPPPDAATSAAPPANATTPPTAPAAESSEAAALVPPVAGPPTLSGHIGGAAGIVRTVVIYGPGSIIREYGRTGVAADGLWSMPLPPPGNYRVVPIGDGSTPIPVRPGFLSIAVKAGEARNGIDFDAGATR